MIKEATKINKEIQINKFDLEDRTLKFSKECIDLCKILVKDDVNNVLASQLMRSSTSIGANYREANDTDTKKDFYHRIGICRREAKESRYWLQLLTHANKRFSKESEYPADEALQLARIFASIAKSRV